MTKRDDRIIELDAFIERIIDLPGPLTQNDISNLANAYVARDYLGSTAF